MIMLVPTAPEVPAVKVVTLVYRHRRGRLTGDVIGQRVAMAHCTSGGLFRSATPVITEEFARPIPGVHR